MKTFIICAPYAENVNINKDILKWYKWNACMFPNYQFTTKMGIIFKTELDKP